MGHLGPSMDPSVGPSRSVEQHWPSKEFLEGVFKGLLNGLSVKALTLPTQIVGAVVGDHELDSQILRIRL